MISFFWKRDPGIYIFEETQKSIQGGIGDNSCPGKYWFNREKCKIFDGYLTTPRSIYGFGKCGAWFFVHKVLFTLQEHVETTKTDKTRFSFDKKMNLLVEQQLFNNVPFQSTKWKKKEMCVDKKLQQNNGDVYCWTCRIENFFKFQPIKRQIFRTAKSAKPAVIIWVVLSFTKINNYVFCWQWHTLFCQNDETWLQKWKTISFSEEISPQITINDTRTWNTKGKFFLFMA